MPRRADSRSCRRAWWPHVLGALACLAFGSAAATAFRGLTLDQALRQLQHQGLNVLYSSALVRPSMEVRDEPQATAPRQILDELIAPHGLAVKEAPNGALLLIRAAPASTGSPASAAGNLQPPVNDLEEIIVSASEYRFVHGDPLAAVTLGAADLQLSPDIGDDPLRAVARLPGVAAKCGPAAEAPHAARRATRARAALRSTPGSAGSRAKGDQGAALGSRRSAHAAQSLDGR